MKKRLLGLLLALGLVTSLLVTGVSGIEAPTVSSVVEEPVFEVLEAVELAEDTEEILPVATNIATPMTMSNDYGIATMSVDSSSKWDTGGLTISFDDIIDDADYATGVTTYEEIDGVMTAVITVTIDDEFEDEDVLEGILSQTPGETSMGYVYGETTLTGLPEGTTSKSSDMNWSGFDGLTPTSDSSSTKSWPMLLYVYYMNGDTWTLLDTEGDSATSFEQALKAKMNVEELIYGTNYKFTTVAGYTSYYKVEFFNNSESLGTEQYKIVFQNDSISTIEGTTYLTFADAITNAGDGDTITLQESTSISSTTTIPAGVTLVIPEGVTLTIGGGYLYNQGTLVNNGTISGTSYGIVNSGTLDGDGVFDFDAMTTKSDDSIYMYTTLPNATWNAPADSTVLLLNDVTVSAQAQIKQSITLDLNKHTVTSTATYNSGIFVYGNNNAVVTIKNGTVQTSTMTSTVWIYNATAVTLDNVEIINTTTDDIYGCMALRAYNSGTVTVNNCTINSDEYGVYASNDVILNIYDSVITGALYGVDIHATTSGAPIVTIGADENDTNEITGQWVIGIWGGYNSDIEASAVQDSYIPKLIVNGGSIGSSDSSYAITGNGTADYTDITINGGTITSGPVAIYHPQIGNFTMTGGTITGASGIQFSSSGNFVMTGGHIIATEEAIDALYKSPEDGDGALAVCGAAVAFLSRGSGYQSNTTEMTATISGDAVLESSYNWPILICRVSKVDGEWKFNEDSTIEISYLNPLTITGGTFIGPKEFNIDPQAVEDDIIAISGGEYAVAPSDDWIVTGYVTSTDTNSNGYYYITNVVAETVTDAVAGLTTDSTVEDVTTAAGTVTEIPNEDLLDHLDEVTSLDELLLSVNDGSLETEVAIDTSSVSITGADEIEDVTDYDLKVNPDADTSVSGLALAVMGGETINEDTTVTVTLNITQTAAAVSMDDETETLNVTITYDISPSKTTVTTGESTSTVTVDDVDINAPVTFKLYLPAIFATTNRVNLVHEGVDLGTYTVYKDGDGNPYINVTVTHFSTFEVTYLDYVSSSGSTNVGTIIYPDGEETEDDEEVETEVDTDDDSFKDVDSDDYFYDAVEWAVENSITSGMTTTTFAPNNDCTREQVVTFLWRAMGEPAVDFSDAFSDVVDGSYYADAVAWAIENGITNGMSDDLFGTGGTATRGQIVTFLYRLAGEPDMAGDCDFTDVDSEAYYYSAVLWAVENGITDGMGDGTFAPDDNCTRGQIVTFLYRYFN